MNDQNERPVSTTANPGADEDATDPRRQRDEVLRELFESLYPRLRQIADHQIGFRHPGFTLNATSLTHEAFLKLANCESPQEWQSTAHFCATVASAMRSILVDNYRRSRQRKNGGDRRRVPLDDTMTSTTSGNLLDLLDLDDALIRLSYHDPKLTLVVEMHYFLGMALTEIGRVMGIPRHEVRNRWDYARAWLYRQLRDRRV